MPTAAVKQEKQAPPEATSSIKQGIVIVEHKIRNLEKRKARLEYYRDLQRDGKELAKDQVAAIAKYDEVVQTLEFARELSKQLNTVATEHAKNVKKQARKEAQERAQHELSLLKETLVIQDVLSSMGQENVREDFLRGKAGVTLTPDELQQFDDLYVELTPKHDDGIPFNDGFQGPAEQLMLLLEGKTKAAFGTTYAALKDKITAISKSGYFDNNASAVCGEGEVVEEQMEAAVEHQPTPDVEISIDQPPPQQSIETKEEEEEAEVVPETGQVLSCTFQSSMVPEDIRTVLMDPTYYASSHLSVFKSGPIDFMQDNELDTPDDSAAIPTLTYTNQSYTPVENQGGAEAPIEEPPLYHNTTEEKDWSSSGGGGGGGDAQSGGEWVEVTEESWATQGEQSWQQQPHNDGFITARGRGGRGRGGGGDRGNKGGGRGGRGGNRGGYNRDNGYYQNGYRERGERGGGRGAPRGGNSSERPSGGRGGGGRGSRGGSHRGASAGHNRQ